MNTHLKCIFNMFPKAVGLIFLDVLSLPASPELKLGLPLASETAAVHHTVSRWRQKLRDGSPSLWPSLQSSFGADPLPISRASWVPGRHGSRGEGPEAQPSAGSRECRPILEK